MTAQRSTLLSALPWRAAPHIPACFTRPSARVPGRVSPKVSGVASASHAAHPLRRLIPKSCPQKKRGRSPAEKTCACCQCIIKDTCAGSTFMESMHPHTWHNRCGANISHEAVSARMGAPASAPLERAPLFMRPPGPFQSEIALELPAFAVIPDQFVDPAGLDLLAGRRQRSLTGSATAFVNVFFVTHKANVLA